MFSEATHIMGGELTWTCQGNNQYVFQLVFYRDCNGATGNTSNETIEVWGHPTVSSINLNYISSTDLSPTCNAVTGSPTPLDCGSGANGGNGLGAIQKLVYQSNPITLVGTPPSSGWIFTYQNFSRNGGISNLVSPSSKGITIVAKMFAIPGANTGCYDNSPQFLQDPYFITCTGSPYQYNMNASDADLDSLHFSFGIPLDHFPNQNYVEGSVPATIPFETGYNFNSPTPNTNFDPGNIPSQIHPYNGTFTFLSNTIGQFNVKIIVQSFRYGVLIAEVMRETQIIVSACSGNTPPNINGPFSGSFETTVDAGTLVNFTLNATDNELLHDNSPQNNTLTASGLLFGNNFTSNSGCLIAPCATLNQTPPITMTQGVSTDFSWQTDCNHVISPQGYALDTVAYHFVFKVQDDYCAIPGVNYATITINVVNPGIVEAPEIECIQGGNNNDFNIQWSQVNDPTGSFDHYEVYADNNLIGTINNIATTSFTHTGVTQAHQYHVHSISGCNASYSNASDSIKNIFLAVNNPNNGTAILQWNDPVSPPQNSMGNYYHIYKEYPAGVWNLYDSVPYGTHFYVDTITICSVNLNYQIVLPNQPCDFISNIDGGSFTDQISPDIPVLYSVSIDSTNNTVTITWDRNRHPDTYGYIIYIQNNTGNMVELAQQFNADDTTFIYNPGNITGPLTFSVAAFDSCQTNTTPPTFQSSAKGEVHTSIFLTGNLNICAKKILLNWTEYVGWNNLSHYEVLAKTTNETNWISYMTTNNLFAEINVNPLETYHILIKAISNDGKEVFSQKIIVFVATPTPPAYHYLKTATVTDDENILIKHYIESNADVTKILIDKEIDGQFENIASVHITGDHLSYKDNDVDVHKQSYTYRVRYIDSCGDIGSSSNIGKTIFLRVQYDDKKEINYLNWTPYENFNGSIVAYHVYRSVDDIFDPNPLAVLSGTTLYYEDPVYGIGTMGKFCYYIVALEATNIYNFSEISRSNTECAVYEPILYVPNAFTPNGVNPIFKPVVTHHDFTQYDFTIFNRWGQVVFKTNDPNVGWDGLIQSNGNDANNDTYIYIVTLYDGNGIQYRKRGHFSLIR